ncbi:MAG TPA: glycosyltransferase family 4 protein [Polyangiaceae bacterium LLY-WYZ-15_(1-7)]|nr:glycosyltransferase family 4 protein [Polyangiaceae bacterium LLY-WYZ-15_(1-7)]HJL08241.1 glycosyltransferase family 4 protein [Polyangiaceae bacterium LLY-WYZ-15_(1-7)]HJL22119.1 glycosyltransferase family 4 protein [Polyangiaceae bacterium LLY-WYZ-15_(1-7)]HJL31143.1 glycosyltransferase family 4 protein [Polyangiaceae bacterium LLY-WYZ-15_(1-7)]HJL45767.1 glycosyltransferase family 4 protein [Polyangiaceae bacterium LLY-WYZ-15_(1-7)]
MDARLRVLVTAFGTVPGPNSHSSALMGMAAALRGDLDLVTRKTPTLSHQGRLGEARLFRVRCEGLPAEQRAAFGRAVKRQLEAEPYDVVHVRGPWEGEYVAPLHRAMGFRFVYEVATFPDEAEGPDAEQIWADAHLRCLEEADLILVGAEAAARSLAEQGFAGKVAVVPPGVDVDAYDWWPSPFGDPVRLIYLGAFTADREIPTLLSALRAASKRIPLRALVAGDPHPERRENVQRMIDAFELGELVSVRGEPRAVALPALIAASDLAVVSASATPRFREFGDLPEPLLEYLACRRPVVAAGVPAVSEVIRDEHEGLVYPPGDETTLADAIVLLATDAARREELVDRAYDRVRARFSGAARRRRIAEVYEMLSPGSQSWDSWTEAFDETVEWAPISSMVDADDVATSENPLPEEPTPAMPRSEDTLVGDFPAFRNVDTSPELEVMDHSDTIAPGPDVVVGPSRDE